MSRILRLVRRWYWRRYWRRQHASWQAQDAYANWEYALAEIRKRNGWLS